MQKKENVGGRRSERETYVKNKPKRRSNTWSEEYMHITVENRIMPVMMVINEIVVLPLLK